MGWAVGFDSNHNRDIGYGVPAKCDHPGCDKDIDRGLGYVCGDDVYGGDEGCGLFFCGHHLSHRISDEGTDDETWSRALCERCHDPEAEMFDPTPDTQEWIDWKMVEPSWKSWRLENPVWCTINWTFLLWVNRQWLSLKGIK